MDYFSIIVNRNLQRGVLIDTKPLLLFLIGSYNPNSIETSKLTQEFTQEDYELLVNFLKRFNQIVTTPNILTEASNLLDRSEGKIRDKLYELFSYYIQEFVEESKPSKETVTNKSFSKYGLTDLAIMDNAKGKYLVLTGDLPLYGYLENIGVDVINFNHLRTVTLLR